MLNLKASVEALNDLMTIWAYIAEDSPINADRFYDKLTLKFEWFCEFSEAGTACDELMKGLRLFPVDRYVIYYFVLDHDLIIVRVLHGSRNMQKIFGGQ